MHRRSTRKRSEAGTPSRVDSPDPISNEVSLNLKLSWHPWRPSRFVLTDLTELQTSSRPSILTPGTHSHRRLLCKAEFSHCFSRSLFSPGHRLSWQTSTC